MGKRGFNNKRSSSFKGVCWRKERELFEAHISLGDGVRTPLGAFSVEEEAAREYDRAAVEHVRLLLSRVECEGFAPARRLDALKILSAFLSRLETNLPLSRDEEGDVERARAVVAAPPASLARSLPPSAVAAATPERRTSRFKGVYWSTKERKWKCRFAHGPGDIDHLPSFPAHDELGAARAVDSAVVEQLELRLDGSSSSSLASSDKREHFSALEWLVSHLEINLPEELTPLQRSTIERAKVAASTGRVPTASEAAAGRHRAASADAATTAEEKAPPARGKEKNKKRPRASSSSSSSSSSDASGDDDDDEDADYAPSRGTRESEKKQRSTAARFSAADVDAAADVAATSTSAAVVPLYTPYDCEGSLQLPDEAALLFDSASDGFLNKRGAKRSDVGCSFEQKVAVGAKAFSVVVHRIPKDAAASASSPGPATAFLALGGPGWLALSKELELAPGRSVRFEVEKGFGSGGGSGGSRGGLVRASTA